MNQKVRKSVLLIGVCLCGMFTMQAYAAGGGQFSSTCRSTVEEDHWYCS